MVGVLLWLAQGLEAPVVDEKAGTLSFSALTLKPEVYAQLKGAIEYVVVNKGGKSYESVFESNVDPMALYEGLKKLGVAPGRPAREDEAGKTQPPEGGKFRIFALWKDGDKERREHAGAFVLDTATGKAMEAVEWLFTGSKKGFIPDLERQDLLVLTSKNLVALHQSDPTVIGTNPVAAGGNRYKVNKDLMPKEGTPVRIVFEAAR